MKHSFIFLCTYFFLSCSLTLAMMSRSVTSAIIPVLQKTTAIIPFCQHNSFSLTNYNTQKKELSIFTSVDEVNKEFKNIKCALSLHQRESIKQFFKQYETELDAYTYNTLFYSCKKTCRLLHMTESEAIEHFSQKLIDLSDKLQSETNMKPEVFALRHFINHSISSGLHVSVSSADRVLGKYPISTLGKYVFILKMIVLGKEFQDAAPVIQYQTLLHEYRHYLQNINGITFEPKPLTLQEIKFYPTMITEQKKIKGNAWKIWEYDADYFAISHITCPMCLKIFQIIRYNFDQNEGYFLRDDMESFIQVASFNTCCPAHSIIPGDDDHNDIVQKLSDLLDLYENVPIKSYNVFALIVKYDKQSGSLLKHIPTFFKDVACKIVQRKEFEIYLAAKLLKELDIRQQSKQYEKDNEQGKYKLLESGTSNTSKII
ncbi:MAG TPA: hypothetical protein VLG50_08965 [Candidatus Saccharimonadales bacterium]|nr:hypothetical protein [Candidatus Saccharimonadales bacterium]